MMTETVVHVTTLDQWKSVLDVWFGKGYEWFSSTGYREDYFRRGSRQLRLNSFNKITFSESNRYSEGYFIEYADFMAQQEKTTAKETYYVTQKQYDLIEELKESDFPVYKFYGSNKYQPLAVANELSSKAEKMLLRYLGGDTSVEFKVKEQLYRLWRIDDSGDTVYMKFSYGTPDWTMYEDRAFTAPREEITKWKTPAWEIEKAD
ncbi:hypothetical protein ACWN9M_04340 [Leuconostoc lactis]